MTTTGNTRVGCELSLCYNSLTDIIYQ